MKNLSVRNLAEDLDIGEILFSYSYYMCILVLSDGLLKPLAV
jgi:hypothetical protein